MTPVVRGDTGEFVGATTAFLEFDPPLDPGPYALELDCDFVGQAGEHASRHFALDPMVVTKASLDAVRQEPKARACGCTAVGAEPLEPRWLALVYLVPPLVHALRRRSRGDGATPWAPRR